MGRTDLLLGDLSAWRPLVGTRRMGGPAWGPKGFWIFLIVGLTLASIGMLWRLKQLTHRLSLDSRSCLTPLTMNAKGNCGVGGLGCAGWIVLAGK